MKIQVPAQTDKQFSQIASNQCSWAAAEFALHNSKLRSLLREEKIEEFQSIYTSCLEQASRLRAEAGSKNLFGENIDTPELLDYYKKKNLTVTSSYTIYKNKDEEFLKILHPDLLREFYTRAYSTEHPVDRILNQIFNSECALVSRHGQSLAVIYYYGKYLICDSHLHTAMVLTREDAISHILMDHGGHLHLTVLLVL
jgi:hypothetical protein